MVAAAKWWCYSLSHLASSYIQEEQVRKTTWVTYYSFLLLPLQESFSWVGIKGLSSIVARTFQVHCSLDSMTKGKDATFGRKLNREKLFSTLTSEFILTIEFIRDIKVSLSKAQYFSILFFFSTNSLSLFMRIENNIIQYTSNIDQQTYKKKKVYSVLYYRLTSCMTFTISNG